MKLIIWTCLLYCLLLLDQGEAQAHGYQSERKAQGHHIEGKPQAHGHNSEHFARKKLEIADAINYLAQEVLDAETEQIEKREFFHRRKREIIAALLGEQQAEGKAQTHKPEIADAINYLAQEVLDAQEEEIEKREVFPRRKREVIADLLGEQQAPVHHQAEGKAQSHGYQSERKAQGHRIEGKSQAHGHNSEHFARKKGEIAYAINYLAQEVLDAEKEQIEKREFFHRRKRDVVAAGKQQAEDLLYLDSTMIVELPSFTPFISCPVDNYPGPVQGAVTAVLNKRILVCGRNAACYSLTGSSWKEEAGMLEGRNDASSSIWPGHGLLVIGGRGGGGKPLSTTEYLSASGQWTPGPVLPVAMARAPHHCQVTAGSDVIITGGGGLASAYKISTDGSSWDQLPSMAAARWVHSCVVHQDYLYAIGGDGSANTTNTTVEKMDLTSNTWETGPELDTGFVHGLAMVYQDTIFLVYTSGKVVKLNSEGDKWEEVTDLDFDRFNGGRPGQAIVTPGALGC